MPASLPLRRTDPAPTDPVATLLGPEWIIPTLWQGDRLPAVPPWPLPFVVKARHGCNQTRFVRTGHENWGAIRAAAARWMRRRYGYRLDEWLYRAIPPGLIVEPFVGEAGELPIDWKIYVFGRQPAVAQVHRHRETAHSRALFTPDWRRLTSPDGLPDPVPPAQPAADARGGEHCSARISISSASITRRSRGSPNLAR